MAIPVRILSGNGNGKYAKVNGENEFNMVVHPHPPTSPEQTMVLPFRQNFTDDGTSAGSSDMTVDGSVNVQQFSITAQNDVDIWIKSISVRIGDQNARLNLFGAITELTNVKGNVNCVLLALLKSAVILSMPFLTLATVSSKRIFCKNSCYTRF